MEDDAPSTTPDGTRRRDEGSPLPNGIVVVGASAGGLKALQGVLEGLPPTFPVPVVIVQHVDRSHRSLLAQILARHTTMPVEEATEGTRLRPSTVTIAVPDRHLLVEPAGVLRLTQTELVHFVRPSIDVLFESAARSHGDACVGVVLSGTGRDGAAGVEAIRQGGGTVVVQDPETAEFPAMPQAAIGTGAADSVLHLDAIARALVDLATRVEPS